MLKRQDYTPYSIPTLKEVEEVLGGMNDLELKRGIMEHSISIEDIGFDTQYTVH